MLSKKNLCSFTLRHVIAPAFLKTNPVFNFVFSFTFEYMDTLSEKILKCKTQEEFNERVKITGSDLSVIAVLSLKRTAFNYAFDQIVGLWSNINWDGSLFVSHISDADNKIGVYDRRIIEGWEQSSVIYLMYMPLTGRTSEKVNWNHVAKFLLKVFGYTKLMYLMSE
jgi:hypothetical protein